MLRRLVHCTTWGGSMTNLEKAFEFSIDPQNSHRAKIFRALLDALYGTEKLNLYQLYDLDSEDFEVAVKAIKDWRLQRFSCIPAQRGISLAAKPEQRLFAHLQ